MLYNANVTTNLSHEPRTPTVSPFLAVDVEAILRERGWLAAPSTAEVEKWMAEAAEWLGLQAAIHYPNDSRRGLIGLLQLIFFYDARRVLESKENHAVMARDGARDVIRELANRVLDEGEIDSERLRQIISELKGIFGSQGRKIFYPLRLALAGRAGEGDLDRVILLVDRAAKIPFTVPLKTNRQRMTEFCAAFDKP